MKRVLAALAAVALVGGALWIRRNVIDDGGSAGGGDRLHLLCGTDLRDVCDALAREDDSIDVTVADEGDTAGELSAEQPSAAFDAWLTAGPWPAMVAEERARLDRQGEVLAASSSVLGRSPVTFVGPRDRLDALAAACGGTLTWTCLGDLSGGPWSAVGGPATWGTVKAGLAPPDTGAGLVPLDQAVASAAGRTDWDALDLDEATPWLGQLASAATVTPDPLRVLLTRPGSFSLAAPLEQRSGPELLVGDRRSTYGLLYPEPMVTADVTLTAAAGSDSDDLVERIGADRLADALAEAGWRVRGRTPAPGTGGGPALPATSQLTSPGALQALRSQWEVLTS